MHAFRTAVLTAVIIAAAPHRLSAQGVDDIRKLAWIAGCWEQRAGSRLTQEQWMAPAGGLMLGMSRTLASDAVREWEQLRIEVQAGVVTYIAQPSGQALAAFKATSVSDTAVVFENPQHDFPTKISYRKVGSDSLWARTEGPRNGQLRGIDFPMRRGRCPG